MGRQRWNDLFMQSDNSYFLPPKEKMATAIFSFPYFDFTFNECIEYEDKERNLKTKKLLYL